MGLFGKAKAQPQSTTKDSVMKVRETLEMLEKREKHLQTKIDKELKIARENAQKNKKTALMALKRKKMYEAEIEKMMNTRMNLEMQMIHIENAHVNLETMKAMETGAKALKDVHGHMDINKVDDTMDEIREQMDLAKEVSDAISTPLGDLGVDDDELLAELDQLEQEELDGKLLDVNVNLDLEVPSVPRNEPVIKGRAAKDEEDELAQLRAEMAM